MAISRKTEPVICLTRQSVVDTINIFERTINQISKAGSKSVLRDEDYDILINAKSGKEIYQKVLSRMDNENHKTLCLFTSIIDRKGTIRRIMHEDE